MNPDNALGKKPMLRLALASMLVVFYADVHAEKRICENGTDVAVMTAGSCPYGYWETGKVDEGRASGNLKFSDKFHESNREFYRDMLEQGKRIGTSIENRANNINAELRRISSESKARREAQEQLSQENKEKIQDIFALAEQFLNDKKFKRWVYKLDKGKAKFKNLRQWDIGAWGEVYYNYSFKQFQSYDQDLVRKPNLSYEASVNSEDKQKAPARRSGIFVTEEKECFGYLLNNKLQGHGGCRYVVNDNLYIGGLRSNRAHGRGAMFFGNGDIYIGDWKDGIRNGAGEYLSKETGNVYRGEYLNGKRHGQGTYIYKSGTRYTGGWKNNKRDGSGSIIRADGWTNIVRYSEGKRAGKWFFLNGEELEAIAIYEQGECKIAEHLARKSSIQIASRLNCLEQVLKKEI